MVGQTFGQYRIEEKLGAGGMGVVYRARDTRLERPVALKLIGERLAGDETARARLLREARSASALNHPNICTIYEVGEAEGQAYIAMELVEGRPLSTLVPAEGLAAETVLRYGTQIADALAHAHERGIVHRDLKTANVVITPEGRAKVLDFGLAKRMHDADLAEATRSTASLTEAGAVAGTLYYMAPELLRGQPADARSDIWALGVVLYEMASGRLPFAGKTGYELSSAILQQSPTAVAHAPTGLRAIIQRCLAKPPGERYQRASEVRAALEALQSADTIPVGVLRRPERRVPRWALAGGIILIGLAILTAVFRDDLRARLVGPGAKETAGQSGPRLSTGGKPSANAEANEYFEKAMTLLTTQYDLGRAVEMLKRALELDSHFAEARGWYGFTHVLMIDAGYSYDTSWLFFAEEEVRRALQDDPNCARAHTALAAVYLYQGHKELMPAEIEKALQANPDELDAPIWLINYYQLNGDYEAARRLAQEQVERRPVFFVPRMLLGDILRQQGDVAGAIREQEKILELDPQNLYAIIHLARAHMDAGELALARRTLERSRPTDRSNFRARVYWGLLLALEGKRAEAHKEMDTDVLNYASTSVQVTSDVAAFYAVLGETDKALEWLERAVKSGDDRSEWFQRDPLLKNIRSSVRFQRILDSIAYRRQQREATAR